MRKQPSKFETIWRGLPDAKRQKLADYADSSPGYLYLIALGHKTPSPKKALLIEAGAKRLKLDITRADLLPQFFGEAA